MLVEVLLCNWMLALLTSFVDLTETPPSPVIFAPAACASDPYCCRDCAIARNPLDGPWIMDIMPDIACVSCVVLLA